jgi:hypothetical protein
MAGYIIQKCSKRAGCTIIKQNFKSIYSSAAISGGNTQPLATAAQSQVSATTAGDNFLMHKAVHAACG